MLRSGIFKALDILGLPSVLLSTKHGKGTVVLYHGVTSEKGTGIFNYRGKHVHTAAFAKQVAWMHKHYTILPLQELLTHPDLGALPRPPLAITFDDGYRNNYTDAFPILRETHTPATFFITTGFIDGTPLPVDTIEYAADTVEEVVRLGTHLKTLNAQEMRGFLQQVVTDTGRNLQEILNDSPYAPMTWSEMQEMERAGMTFAPHTVTHPILAHLDAQEQKKEIIDSYNTVKEHLDPLAIFAYPNGSKKDYTDDTVSILKEAGFAASLTTQPGVMARHSNMFELPRYTLDGTNDLYRFRLTVVGAR
ncbi:MAG: hypothetical protein JWO43_458 [Candidatus Adlerbacteria bacterium]|nr:hypothetical protein [Candidatus Adlerbacteria bacterium]